MRESERVNMRLDSIDNYINNQDKHHDKIVKRMFEHIDNLWLHHHQLAKSTKERLDKIDDQISGTQDCLRGERADLLEALNKIEERLDKIERMARSRGDRIENRQSQEAYIFDEFVLRYNQLVKSIQERLESIERDVGILDYQANGHNKYHKDFESRLEDLEDINAARESLTEANESGTTLIDEVADELAVKIEDDIYGPGCKALPLKHKRVEVKKITETFDLKDGGTIEIMGLRTYEVDSE